MATLTGGTFIGRQQEMDKLKAALEDALSGQGRLFMLVGEPGIGKTRTAQELVAYAEESGARVLWGWCYEGEGAPPYWPWVQPIRTWVLQNDPDQLRSEMGPGAANIAEIIPEVHAKLSGLNPPPALGSPEEARFRLFESITAFLKSAAQTQPLVLMLDDLHWVDQPSLLLLQFLAQQLGESRLLVVGAYRDNELSRQHPLSKTLAQLSRLPCFQRQLLRGLSREDTRHFIEATAGIQPSQSLATIIYAHTEGNPFFMKEVIRFLSERKELIAEEMGGPQGIRIPEGVREVIGQRLNRLSEECRQTLVTAAVIGRKFSLKELGLLVDDLLEDRLLDAVEEALAARLIEEVPGSTEGYQFSHTLIQETLASELSTARRVRVHARIADTLEKLYTLQLEAHAAELAHHFAEAEPVLGPEKLVHYSLLAGERALATYAWEEALAHFERGLVAKRVPLTGTGPAKDAEEAALLFGLGRARATTLPTQRLEEASINLDRSFKYYAAAKDVASAISVAEYHLPTGSGSRSTVNQRVKRALSLVSPGSVAAGRLLPTYAMELGRYENNYNKAQEAFERALVIARRGSDVDLEMRTLAAWASVDHFHLHLAESLEKSLQVVELARHADDPHMEVNGHHLALRTLNHLGEGKNAEEHAKAALALAERLRSRHWLSVVFRNGINLYHFLGDWRQARELISRHIAVDPNYAPLLKELVWLQYELGEFEQGEAYLKRMQEIMRQTSPSPGPEYADTSLVLHFASRITGSSDYLEVAGQAAQVVLSSPLANPFWIDIVRTGLALHTVETKDYALAEEQYIALIGLQGKMRGSFICGDRLMGLLAHTMGNPDQAAAHFEDALAFCRKAGFRPELAWSCYDNSDLLLARDHPGDHDRAMSSLEEALTLSTELGMRPLMERVRALWEQAKVQPARVPAYPNGLTHREVEVLRLVTTGKTDREIAEALSISVTTVSTHVRNILNKINAANRTEATAYSAQHGLL